GSLFLSIHDCVRPISRIHDNHSIQVQDLLRTIRTELDTFTPEEVFALYRHGYRVAHQTLATYGLADPFVADAPRTPVDSTTLNLGGLEKDGLEASLSGSHALKKQFKGTLIRLVAKRILRDYAPLLVAGVVVCLAVIGGAGYAVYTSSGRRAELSTLTE